eukprot:m.21510 g.21510  ORF g.21510 m.21510 type:complete len:330 (+) comp10485_c0_seq1:70-1059(+)
MELFLSVVVGIMVVAVGYGVLQLVRFATGDGDLAVTSATVPDGWWNGKVVWITGASGGIGAAFARDVAGRGATVVLSARRADELEAVKESCVVVPPCKGHGIVIFDAVDFESHESKVAEMIKRFGRIDVLVLNAGRGGSELCWQTEFETTKKMVDLNVLGPISLTKLVLPHMLAAKTRCSLAVTSSLGGKIAIPGTTSYSMTKFAVQGYYEAARYEVKDNVDVTLICPGPVGSEFGVNKMLNAADPKSKSTFTTQTTGGKIMSTERCAELMAVAISNQMPEVWLSSQPELAITYLNQYAPVCTRYILAPMAKKMIAPLFAKGAQKATSD